MLYIILNLVRNKLGTKEFRCQGYFWRGSRHLDSSIFGVVLVEMSRKLQKRPFFRNSIAYLSPYLPKNSKKVFKNFSSAFGVAKTPFYHFVYPTQVEGPPGRGDPPKIALLGTFI